MRLNDLLAGFPQRILSPRDVDVSGIQHDSRRVQPGDLFAAIAGRRHDGIAFEAEAIAKGAVAVLASRPPAATPAVPWIVAEDPRALMGSLAARLHGHPDRELTMIGVTGTNGKTTTVWLVQSILSAAGIRTGKLGSVPTEFRGVELATGRTTPEAPELLRLLRELRDLDASAVAMEVSSQGLVLGRVRDVRFDVAVFTHLTRDHLDFHGSMEAYFEAKARLFAQLKSGGCSVVNVGDPWGRRLAERLGEVSSTLTFGPGGMVECLEAKLDARGTRARLRTPRGELPLESPLLGDFNLHNVVAAAAVAEALALPGNAIVEGVRAMRSIPGRMEPVDRGQAFPVFVDYAHTDDALRRVYTAVRSLTGRKLIAVFGCQGERDRGKRELMGRVAGELADLLIVTADNPRSEDPRAIMEAIAHGARLAGHATVRLVADRAEAIRGAIAAADGRCAILVTGKGEDTGQEVGDELLPFSDREVIEGALDDLRVSRRA